MKHEVTIKFEVNNQIPSTGRIKGIYSGDWVRQVMAKHLSKLAAELAEHSVYMQTSPLILYMPHLGVDKESKDNAG